MNRLREKSLQVNVNVIDKIEKSIVIEGLKKEESELEKFRDKIMRFYHREYVINFTLFPPLKT